MILLFYLIIISIGFFLLFLILGKIFQHWQIKGEKVAPIESGFISYNFKFIKFRIQFFLILILFIIFDVEILLLLISPIRGFLRIFNCVSVILFIFITLKLEWLWSKVVWF